MKSPGALFSRGSRRTAVGLAALILLSAVSARADMPEGKVTKDTVVGANHDIVLKTGYVVQIMNQSGANTVIMVPLPDGSNGIFQVDSGTIQAVPAGTPLGLPAPPAPPPPPPGTVAPSYPLSCIGKPNFETPQGNHASGLANLLVYQPSDPGYIVTVRHLLGPLGGFANQIAAKDVPTAVQTIQIADYTGASTDYAVTGLVVRSARPRAEGGSPADDLAIFQLHVASPHAQQVTLSDQLPAIGDHVWLIARLRDLPPDQVAHRAQITANKSWLEVPFDDTDLHLGSANGAPVLDEKGHVVGVFARSIQAAGQNRGYIIPSTLIVKTIQSQPH